MRPLSLCLLVFLCIPLTFSGCYVRAGGPTVVYDEPYLEPVPVGAAVVVPLPGPTVIIGPELGYRPYYRPYRPYPPPGYYRPYWGDPYRGGYREGYRDGYRQGDRNDGYHNGRGGNHNDSGNHGRGGRGGGNRGGGRR